MEYLQYRCSIVHYFSESCVLNLVISGIPSIRKLAGGPQSAAVVLNLVISGMPSILEAMN